MAKKFTLFSQRDGNESFELETNNGSIIDAAIEALSRLGYSLVAPKEPEPIISYILSDGDGSVLSRGSAAIDGESSECRYDSLELAREELPDVAKELEMSENDIVILRETLEEV